MKVDDLVEGVNDGQYGDELRLLTESLSFDLARMSLSWETEEMCVMLIVCGNKTGSCHVHKLSLCFLYAVGIEWRRLEYRRGSWMCRPRDSMFSVSGCCVR